MVIDLYQPTLFATRITVFTYRDSLKNGWPSKTRDQRYVRFLQDQGIKVGFTRDTANGIHVAMVSASDVAAVADADREAITAGVEKPPIVEP